MWCIKNCHAHKNNNLGNYEYDNKLSNSHQQVYYNKNS
jgi:hypothetical protein